MTDEKNKPVKKFRAGNCTATVWKNKITVDGKDIETHSVNIEKSYKDKNDEWKTTSSFNKNEMPKAILVMEQAYEFLASAKSEDVDGKAE